MKWDVPNKRWSDGYHWDQTSPISPEVFAMQVFKVLLSFTAFGEALFGQKAELRMQT